MSTKKLEDAVVKATDYRFLTKEEITDMQTLLTNDYDEEELKKFIKKHKYNGKQIQNHLLKVILSKNGVNFKGYKYVELGGMSSSTVMTVSGMFTLMGMTATTLPGGATSFSAPASGAALTDPFKADNKYLLDNCVYAAASTKESWGDLIDKSKLGLTDAEILAMFPDYKKTTVSKIGIAMDTLDESHYWGSSYSFREFDETKDLEICAEAEVGGRSMPLELLGTGYLQLIQIFCYILLFYMFIFILHLIN